MTAQDPDDHDLQDWMHRATETLVIDPPRISANAVRGGRRRRRARGLVLAAVAASVVVVTGVSAQVVGDRVTDRSDLAAEPGQHVEGPGPANGRTAIGNVTITRHAGGSFTAKGGLAPRATTDSHLELWAGRRGETLMKRADYSPQPGIGVFGRRFRLSPGIWNIQLRYVYGDGTFATGTYATAIVLRDAPPVSGTEEPS